LQLASKQPATSLAGTGISPLESVITDPGAVDCHANETSDCVLAGRPCALVTAPQSMSSSSSSQISTAAPDSRNTNGQWSLSLVQSDSFSEAGAAVRGHGHPNRASHQCSSEKKDQQVRSFAYHYHLIPTTSGSQLQIQYY